jgi:PKD repeat protein
MFRDQPSSVHRKPSKRLWWSTTLLLVIAASVSLNALAAGQFATRRSKKGAVDEEIGEIAKPQILNPDSSNPTLRYPAASFSGWSVMSTSYGWFDVTRDGIRYTVVQPPGKLNEGFESGKPELSEIEIKYAYLTFKASGKKHMVFYMPEESWGSIHSGPGAMAAAGRGAMGTSSMLQAVKNFDRVLAQVKPPPPPAPEAALSANPASIERGHPATLVWTSQNAASLRIDPEVGVVEAAGSRSVTPQQATTYTLTAQGPGGTKTVVAHVEVTQALPPTLVLVEPSVGNSGQTLEVSSPTFKIRGVAMDNAGIPVVSINGSPVNLRPQSAQAAEFFSDSLTLHQGDNKFEIVATNRAQVEATLAFVARYTPPPPPPPPAPEPNPKAFTKEGILDLLSNFVASARVADLVRQYGLKFNPSEADLQDIRAAGGTDDLIAAMREATKAQK